jgi:hypothetical protein
MSINRECVFDSGAKIKANGGSGQQKTQEESACGRTSKREQRLLPQTFVSAIAGAENFRPALASGAKQP